MLARSLSFGDPLRFTQHRERDGEAFFRQACQDGWEGLIAKRADAPYRGAQFTGRVTAKPGARWAAGH